MKRMKKLIACPGCKQSIIKIASHPLFSSVEIYWASSLYKTNLKASNTYIGLKTYMICYLK